MPGTHSRESSRDAYMDVGGRANQEIEPSGDRERIRTNIGHIRVKMSGTYFPDKVEDVVEPPDPPGEVEKLQSKKDILSF